MTVTAGISFAGSVGAPAAYIDFVDKAAVEAALAVQHVIRGHKLTVLEKIPREQRTRRMKRPDNDGEHK